MCGVIMCGGKGKKRISMQEIKQEIPAICVPITGKNEQEILEQLTIIKDESPDIIE